MFLIGRVSWWDKRDEEGAITDHAGKEYYFNKSSFSKRWPGRVVEGQFVSFKVNPKVLTTLCAEALAPIPARSRKRVREEFENIAALSAAA